jgi:hypothetical protein
MLNSYHFIRNCWLSLSVRSCVGHYFFGCSTEDSHRRDHAPSGCIDRLHWYRRGFAGAMPHLGGVDVRKGDRRQQPRSESVRHSLAPVGLSQAIQVPIALTASLGNFWIGSLDLVLAALLSIGIAFGSVAGARLAHAVPAVFLARLVAVALVLMGVVVAVRSGHTLVETW